jgi:hypothetical protein
MTQNVFNPHPLSGKINSDNQPIFTAADIKNETFIDQVDRSKGFSQFNKVKKLILVTNGPPGIKRFPGLGIPTGKFIKNLSCDHMHNIAYLKYFSCQEKCSEK